MCKHIHINIITYTQPRTIMKLENGIIKEFFYLGKKVIKDGRSKRI